MNHAEPIELVKALAFLRADYDTGRRLLEADLEKMEIAPEEAEIWLKALSDIHHSAASTLFRIDSGAPPKPN